MRDSAIRSNITVCSETGRPKVTRCAVRRQIISRAPQLVVGQPVNVGAGQARVDLVEDHDRCIVEQGASCGDQYLLRRTEISHDRRRVEIDPEFAEVGGTCGGSVLVVVVV